MEGTHGPHEQGEIMNEDNEEKELLYKDECYRIRKCAFEVNRKLGIGFLEAVYQEAMEIELRKANIPFESQKSLPIRYDECFLKQCYRADFVCFEKIIVEIKAVTKIGQEHKAQIFNYLSASGLKLGILINFHAFPKAEIIRIVR
ncbi:MAG: GxxExxY protein [Spirochaetaceae bacterium]|jgi:GxxExxY protein|nr:GxxExxY protein [Spirochaetaceae bacterium]